MVFHVRATTSQGQQIRRRFEAPSGAVLYDRLSELGCRVERIRAWPLSSGPYGRIWFLPLEFPVFAFLGLMSVVKAAIVATELLRRPLAETLTWQGWGYVAILALTTAVCAIVVYNFLLRLGWHVEISPGIYEYLPEGESVLYEAPDSSDETEPM